MRYLLRTNAGYKHLPKKFEQAVSTYVGRDSSQMAVCRRSFFLFVSSFSEREWPLRARQQVLSCGPSFAIFYVVEHKNVGALLNEFLN